VRRLAQSPTICARACAHAIFDPVTALRSGAVARQVVLVFQLGDAPRRASISSPRSI
jgi:hypothetical protein